MSLSPASKGNVLIGVDAGTSVIKAVAFTADGEALGSSSVANQYRTDTDGTGEQDITQTWQSTLQVLSQLLNDNEGMASRVVCIAVTGQGDGTWLLDDAGEPVHNAWLWLDSRSIAEVEALEESPGMPLIYERTGTGVNVCQMRAQLNWMKKHTPEVLDKAAVSFHCKDYLYFKLTGVRATDPSEGVFTFGNLKTRDLDNEVIDALGLSEHRHLLPPIVDGCEQAGSLTRELSRQLGLADELPVVLGYVDVICTALGGGLYAPDTRPGLSIIGSTGMHMKWIASADEITLNEARSGYTMLFPGGGLAQMQSNMAATINIDWLIDVACEAVAVAGFEVSRQQMLERLEAAVAQQPPGHVLYHPYISHAGERGPFTAPQARASFTGLDQSVGYAGMMRAVYEGLAMAARDCFDAMGALPEEIRLSGGAARSAVLRNILGAALARPLRLVESEEAGAAGACMIAAVQIGLFDDLSACCDAWVNSRLGDAIEPDQAWVQHYERLLPVYQDTRKSLSPHWSTLARIRE